MGVFDIFRRQKRTVNSDVIRFNNLFGISNEGLTEKQAMSIPAFASCVDFISSAVAGLPIKLYEKQDDMIHEIRTDDRLVLLNKENDDIMNCHQMKKAFVSDYLKNGNGYIYIDKVRNEPKSLKYVKSGNVQVFIDETNPVNRKVKISVMGRSFNSWEFLTIARNTTNGLSGYGLIADSNVLKTAYALNEFQNKLVHTGGAKKGFIQAQRRLEQKALDELKRQWDILYNNIDSNVMVLNDGLQFKEASSTSVEMQLQSMKQKLDDDICRMFPLNMNLFNGKATDEDYLNAIKIGVIPVINEFENALNRSLLLENEKETKFFEIDTTELLKGDTLKRYQAYQVALNSGFLTIDEVRRKETEEPFGLEYIKLGLGDVYFNPENKEFFVPNTNQVTSIENSKMKGGENENETGD